MQAVRKRRCCLFLTSQPRVTSRAAKCSRVQLNAIRFSRVDSKRSATKCQIKLDWPQLWPPSNPRWRRPWLHLKQYELTRPSSSPVLNMVFYQRYILELKYGCINLHHGNWISLSPGVVSGVGWACWHAQWDIVSLWPCCSTEVTQVIVLTIIWPSSA